MFEDFTAFKTGNVGVWARGVQLFFKKIKMADKYFFFLGLGFDFALS